MATPIPGTPVRGSRSGIPVMALFDLLGRNWAMGIIWHLNKGPSTFRKIQEYCEAISPTILNKRLKELTEARFIEKTADGYMLTDQGHQLFSHLEPLGRWSKTWAASFQAP